jgi:hypothetical protein
MNGLGPFESLPKQATDAVVDSHSWPQVEGYAAMDADRWWCGTLQEQVTDEWSSSGEAALPSPDRNHNL